MSLLAEILNLRLLLILAAFALTVTVVMSVRKNRRRGGRHRSFRKKARRVARTLAKGEGTPAGNMAYLRKINPFVFEELVLDGFQAKGYSVKRNRRYTGDGGVDGRVYLDGKEFLVQCKRYRGYIKNSDVEAFAGLCAEKGAEGFFVHTGKTGQGSRSAARIGNIYIISGDSLLNLIQKRDCK